MTTDVAPGAAEAPTLQLPELDPVDAGTPADTKPRRGRRTAAPKEDKAPRPTAARKRTAPLATRLSTTLTTIGMVVGLVNEFDGLTICKGAPAFATALAEAAEENPALKASLERALSIGTFGKTFAAGAAIGVPIAANHGLIPRSIAGLFGSEVPPPGGESAPPA